MMTYAWALVAVLAVIAVVFYVGVLKAPVVSTPSCDLAKGMACVDFKLNRDTAYLNFKLGNDLARRINVTSLKCTQETYNPSSNWRAVGITIAPGEEKWIAHIDGLDGSPASACCYKNDGLSCYPNSASGQPYSGKVWINYTELDTRVNRTIQGTVNGQFE